MAKAAAALAKRMGKPTLALGHAAPAIRQTSKRNPFVRVDAIELLGAVLWLSAKLTDLVCDRGAVVIAAHAATRLKS